MKLIEVDYVDYSVGSGWKWEMARTRKLCKLLKRIFGKNADIVQSSSECYLKHVSGQGEYYTVVKRDSNSNGNGGWIVGKIYIGGYDGDTFPEDFFEEDEEN